MTDDWEGSAQEWIDAQGEAGDWTRVQVLDGPMLARVDAGGFTNALDVGCGEGRFCRMLRTRRITAIGIDPTHRLIEEARMRDPDGDYRMARAEALPFEDGRSDLVVSYLSLIDIPDLSAAIAEMTRVLAPGGALLIANLTSFSTASAVPGVTWTRDAAGNRLYFAIDHYLEARAEQVSWDDISVVNYHRPLSAYMALLLAKGLRLTHFEEPRARGADDERAAAYNRVPWAFIMEWRKI
jgi:SAM-dependent methyltransferase